MDCDHGGEICCVLTQSRATQFLRVQFEPVSGHPATNIDDALLDPSGCHGDVFTAAMQVQLRVIGKQVKSDIVSVDNVHKVSHVQHEQYWAKD